MANELVHASVGTVLSQTEYEAVGAHVFNSGATGDIPYGSSATQLSRLAIGATNTILTVTGGIPAWTSTPTLAGLTMTGAISMGANGINGVGTISRGDAGLTIQAGGAWTVQTKNLAGTMTDRITFGNGADLVTMALPGVNLITFTGTIAATGARVTQSYHTNITSTNAVTVDSSRTVKHDLAPYLGDALDIIRRMDVVTFRHQDWLDISQVQKLGIIAESVDEPLALERIAREDGVEYPGVNLYALIALHTKAIQQLESKLEEIAT